MLAAFLLSTALCPTARVLNTARLATSRSGVAVALDVGNLVQFEKRKGEVSIGALVSADEKTKRNWLVVDAAGNSQSVPPKAIRLAVPGSRATGAAEVAAHESAATEALETQADVLDDVWDLALEDAASELELPALAELFFGSADSTDCYAALALLESGRGHAARLKRVATHAQGHPFVPTWDPSPHRCQRKARACPTSLTSRPFRRSGGASSRSRLSRAMGARRWAPCRGPGCVQAM